MEQGIALSSLTFNGKICAMNITWDLPSKQPKQFFKFYLFFETVCAANFGVTGVTGNFL